MSVPKKDKLFFSVVVPVSRPSKALERLVKSLESQTMDRKDFEVILVGETASLSINHLKGFKSIPLGKVGANTARNQGLKVAKGWWVFFCDDDCCFEDKNLLMNWRTKITSMNGLSICGGSYKMNDPVSSIIDKSYNQICYFWQKYSAKETAHLLGGHMLVRSDVFDKLSFDESIIYGGTEVDFLKRARALNFDSQWFEEFELQHHPKMNLKTFLIKAYKQGKAKNNHNYRVTSQKKRCLFKNIAFLENRFYCVPLFAAFALSSRVGQLVGLFKRLPFCRK